MKAGNYKIAIDGGHGIDTAGKRTPPIPELDGRVILENEFNDAVVDLLDRELKRCGFQTLITAPELKDVPLATRVARANNAKCDIFVSIHYNAYDAIFGTKGGDPEGLEVFFYPGSVEGKKLAQAIYDELKKGTPQKLRGVKSANFHVLRETKMPAALSENGFMDNKKEALLMINKEFQKEVAIEHAKGICNYFKVPYVAESKPTTPTQPAKPTTEGYLVRITADELNVRAQSNNTSKINTSVKKGGVYTIVATDGSWGKLKSGAGWIHLSYTQRLDTPIVVPKPDSKHPYLVRVTAAVLNVRTQPNTSSKISTTVKRGQVYTIVDTNGKWGRLKSGAGWIHLDYTSKV